MKNNKIIRNLVAVIILFSLIPFIFAETESPIGTFDVSNVAPPTPHTWIPTTTHNKTQNFTWTQPTDDNGDPVQTYVCITNDSNRDDCSVVDTLKGNNTFWYAFDLSESNWDYLWGTASRTYYVNLTPYDGTINGTANTTITFTLTDALPTISGQTSDASSDGDKDVAETITFSMTSHADTDTDDNHSLRVCKSDSINTSGECPGGEYCNEHNSTYSTDASLACTYTALQGDANSNTAYFFVCDCPPYDNTCPGQCSSSYSHTFYVNHAPSASNGNITPDNATSSETLNCNYTFSDSTDSDSEGTSTFRWFNYSGGSWELTAFTSSTLDSTNTFEGDVWLCEITPVDEHSFAGSPVNSTNETITNSAPNQPASFTVQDGASSYDSAIYPDTHDKTPNINWSTSDNDTLDSVTTYVCIATNATNRNNDICDGNYTTTATNSVTAVSGLNYSGTNRTYYVRLTPYDGEENGTVLDTEFYLLNSIPNIPYNLTPNSTHSQTPTLAWNATDDDNGSVDGWPADTLTYHIRVGTIYGDGTYESNDNADKTGEAVDSAIPWGTPGAVWANNTVNVSIWTSDGNGNNSPFYNTTLVLYDFLPEVTDIQMTDNGSAYSSCTTATCALNPIEHSNATVAVRVTANDTDNDCDTSSSAYIYLCLDTSSCTPSDGNYSWQIDSVSRSGTVCTYMFSANKSAADSTPEFFRLPNSDYDLYVNVTSQAGQRISGDSERTANWTYGTVKAVDYPATVTLGDGTPTLNQWNDGTSLSTMTNWGNDNLNMLWNISDPTSSSDSWTLNSTDFQIDDDNSQSSEAGGAIAPVFLNATQKTFEPASGLQVCSSYLCNDASLNETLATYYHIFPPLGLLAGTYNSTIIITIS